MSRAQRRKDFEIVSDRPWAILPGRHMMLDVSLVVKVCGLFSNPSGIITMQGSRARLQHLQQKILLLKKKNSGLLLDPGRRKGSILFVFVFSGCTVWYEGS